MKFSKEKKIWWNCRCLQRGIEYRKFGELARKTKQEPKKERQTEGPRTSGEGKISQEFRGENAGKGFAELCKWSIDINNNNHKTY